MDYDERRCRREQQPLDFSPSSTAVDPTDAAQDMTESEKTGRHAYTTNATFTNEQLERTDSQRSGIGETVDASNDPRTYTSLNELNKDFHVVESDDTDPTTKTVAGKQRRHDERNDCREWGRRIGLTSHEISRGLALLQKCHNNANRQNNQAIILAALTIAANEDNHAPQKIIQSRRASIATSTPAILCHDDMVETFETIRDDLAITIDEIKSAREYINNIR